MSHRQVIERALADRLAQFEGSRTSERPVERQKFLRETTTMILTMLEYGLKHPPVPETTNFPLVEFAEPFPLPPPRCPEGCVIPCHHSH